MASPIHAGRRRRTRCVARRNLNPLHRFLSGGTAAQNAKALLAARQTDARHAHPAGSGEDQPYPRGARRRNDGYHGIRSVMVPLELSDELTMSRTRAFASLAIAPSSRRRQSGARSAARDREDAAGSHGAAQAKSRCKPAWEADRATPQPSCARRWQARSDLSRAWIG